MEITRETLLTVAGIAFITAILLQLLIKPWLTKRYADKWWHDITMNVSAAVIGVALGLAGLYIGIIPSDGPAMAFATIQGLVAAFSAVYGYEVVKNTLKFTVGNK